MLITLDTNTLEHPVVIPSHHEMLSGHSLDDSADCGNLEPRCFKPFKTLVRSPHVLLLKISIFISNVRAGDIACVPGFKDVRTTSNCEIARATKLQPSITWQLQSRDAAAITTLKLHLPISCYRSLLTLPAWCRF